VSAENEVPAGEIRLFDSQWSNIVNGETTVEGAVKATEKAMRRNFEDGAFPPPRAFFTKTITDLQSSLTEKDATIAELREEVALRSSGQTVVNELLEAQMQLDAELRARCSAAEKMVGVARTFFNSVYFAGGGGSGLCAAFDAYDAEIAAQHAQRKEEGS
jgi:hypothetical protein